jgi:hypothetical protein
VHDDIKYSGPLSFQSFQILGWSCIVVTVILALIKIGIRLNPEDMKRFESFSDALMSSEKRSKIRSRYPSASESLHLCYTFVTAGML